MKYLIITIALILGSSAVSLAGEASFFELGMDFKVGMTREAIANTLSNSYALKKSDISDTFYIQNVRTNEIIVSLRFDKQNKLDWAAREVDYENPSKTPYTLAEALVVLTKNIIGDKPARAVVKTETNRNPGEQHDEIVIQFENKTVSMYLIRTAQQQTVLLRESIFKAPKPKR